MISKYIINYNGYEPAIKCIIRWYTSSAEHEYIRLIIYEKILKAFNLIITNNSNQKHPLTPHQCSHRIFLNIPYGVTLNIQ